MIEFFVPGRIEFLGKHTDYAGGRSLLCPIERGVRITATPRNDGLVRVRDARLNETVECAFDPNLERPRGSWANYPFTVVRRLARDFPDARTGADLVFESDLPSAAGMSSSSAIVVAVALALTEVNELANRASYRENIQSLEDLAEYVGCIENGATFKSFAGDEGVGTLNGCEDQTAMICGRAGELVQYSFCPVRLETRCALPGDHVFVIASSGVVADKTGSALEKYNAVSRRARAALDAWRANTGGSAQTLADAIAIDGADAVRESITRATSIEFTAGELLDRFDQFHLESNVLVPAALTALTCRDLSTLGTLVDRSQEAVERLLGNQVPETIELARTARELGAVAASAFGAGFGGSVWALVRESSAPEFAERWRDRYSMGYPKRAESASFIVTRAGPPARRVH